MVGERNLDFKTYIGVQKSIPYMQIRGGSSKGLFFQAKDLPTDELSRNELIIRIMEGSLLGDIRQIDGLGGANSLTSKVAIVSPSSDPDLDLDYEFIQVVVGKARVSASQTCGNILAGVLHFAIENGLINAVHPTTSAKIKIVNTGGICEVVVQTPNGIIQTSGETKIDGVMGTAAPIICNYLDTVGSTCGALMPTGQAIDTIDGIELTCIDNGMPMVILQATDFGIAGNEAKDVLDANEALKQKIEEIRIKAGYMMNLGKVAEKTIPKMCLVSPAENGGIINTRMFIPHVVHEAIGVLAAVSVATACVISETICSKMISNSDKIPNTEESKSLSIEHPSGEFTVNLAYDISQNSIQIKKSGVVRTARILSKGVAYY